MNKDVIILEVYMDGVLITDTEISTRAFTNKSPIIPLLDNEYSTKVTIEKVIDGKVSVVTYRYKTND